MGTLSLFSMKLFTVLFPFVVTFSIIRDITSQLPDNVNILHHGPKFYEEIGPVFCCRGWTGATSAVWQATQLEYGTSVEISRSFNNIKTAETRSDRSDTEASVRIHTRAVSIFFIP